MLIAKRAMAAAGRLLQQRKRRGDKIIEREREKARERARARARERGREKARERETERERETHLLRHAGVYTQTHA